MDRTLVPRASPPNGAASHGSSPRQLVAGLVGIVQRGLAPEDFEPARA